MTTKFDMLTCKRSLGTAWLAGAGALFVVVMAQSLMGRYGESMQDAWGWFLPNIMPTLSLIVGVLAVSAKETQAVDAFVFRLAYWLSVFYLLTLATAILVSPLVSQDPLPAMKSANIWLGPLQGLASAALGRFFVKKGK